MAQKKGYIFTDKRHSDKAIMATILGTISLVSLCVVVFLSYKKGGDVPAGYGMTGLLAILFSLIGLLLGLVTVREKENYRLFPCLGLVLNLLSLAGGGFLLYLGM